MASVRLTNLMRERLQRALIEHRFHDEVVAYLDKSADFAQRVFDHIWPQTLREKLAKLPKGWLPEVSEFDVRFTEAGNSYTTLYLKGATCYGELSRARRAGSERKAEPRRIPYKDKGITQLIEPLHPLAEEFDSLKAEEAALRARIKEAETQALSALNSVTTVGALVKLWPEVEPFARKYETVVPDLPALPTAKLNAIFDLPVDAPVHTSGAAAQGFTLVGDD